MDINQSPNHRPTPVFRRPIPLSEQFSRESPVYICPVVLRIGPIEVYIVGEDFHFEVGALYSDVHTPFVENLIKSRRAVASTNWALFLYQDTRRQGRCDIIKTFSHIATRPGTDAAISSHVLTDECINSCLCN